MFAHSATHRKSTLRFQGVTEATSIAAYRIAELEAPRSITARVETRSRLIVRDKSRANWTAELSAPLSIETTGEEPEGNVRQ